jgi:citrate lyase beta subunit
MNLFIVSQNLVKSNMKFPKDTILRVNLAWHRDLESVRTMLLEHADHDIFLDIPVGRKKPPNHKHDVDDISKISNSLPNVKYVAISNVEEPGDIHYHAEKFRANIVPKIETYKGVMNVSKIMDAMNYDPKVLMLDHEDLFSNLIHLKREHEYLDVVENLIDACKNSGARLLRVKGIIFSD